MPTASGLLYGQVIASAFSKKIDWLGDVVKAAMCTSAYVPNQDTHVYLSDVTNECTGGTYARQTLTGKTDPYTAATNVLALSANPITFAGVTLADFRWLVVFVDTGVASTSPLIGYWDYGSVGSAAAQDVTWTPPAGGMFTGTVA